MSSPCTCTDRLLRWLLVPLLVFLPVLAAAQVIEKALMPGEVIAGHAKFELDCDKCHQRFDKSAQTRLCLACHKDVATDVSTRTRLHGRLDDRTCRGCHTEHKGRGAEIAPLDPKKFDHAQADFKLLGAHRDAKCEACHQPQKKYRQAPGKCSDCHAKDDAQKGHKGHLGNRCESCHDQERWTVARFDHEKTKFSLLGGKHAEVACAKCHVDRTYQATPRTCNGCHRKDDQQRGHRGRYGAKCESCHNDKSWKQITFDHDVATRYALKGGHRQATCASCHVLDKGGTIYEDKPSTRCVACHRGDDQQKGHRGELGEKCESCHDERAWKSSGFDHDRSTFPLRDKHRSVRCEACHAGGVSGAGASIRVDRACIACHRKDDREKGHRGELGEKCENCHDARDWKGSGFDHDRSDFPLLDKHRGVKCEACHVGGVSGPGARIRVERTCFACHRPDDQKKGHRGRYGEKCESCHSERGWTETRFDHDRDTRYPLRGGHGRAKCDACHLPEKGVITSAKLDTACIACHRKDDSHKGQLGAKCESCHDESRWKGKPFNHNLARFPLTGSHVGVECAKCHKTPAYRDASSRCYACHEKEDKHEGRFGSRCETCHYTGTWKSWDFDHARTRFPLDGAHRKLQCDLCHTKTSAANANPSRACVACHAKDDGHDGRFGAQCERCHVATDWKRAWR